MLTRKPVFGIVGAIAGVLTVSAVKSLLVKVKINPSEDTYVSDLDKAAIYGYDPGLNVRDNVETITSYTLLKFLNLPTGKDLKLNLYCNWWWNYCEGGRVIPPEDGYIGINSDFYVDGDWEEETLCWNPNGDSYNNHLGTFINGTLNKFYEDIRNKWVVITIPKDVIVNNLTIVLSTFDYSRGCVALQFNSKEGTYNPFITL